MLKLSRKELGFTLIELSIVLVIIGLIIGGILVGRDLIDAASVRAQIGQIEKYQSAVNTFRVKYGYIPGDIPTATASQYGFSARTSDGDGTLNNGSGALITTQETALFWNDLSRASLIDGGFSSANASTFGGVAQMGAAVSKYLPPAKIGANNYVYAWSGGYSVVYNGGDRKNYFSIATIIGLHSTGAGASPGLTVTQAYNIDRKMDDGLPQTGGVTAQFAMENFSIWAAGPISYGVFTYGAVGYGGSAGDSNSDGGTWDANSNGPVTSAGDIGDGATGNITCYDGDSGMPERYSLQSNAALINCALSFQFQ